MHVSRVSHPSGIHCPIHEKACRCDYARWKTLLRGRYGISERARSIERKNIAETRNRWKETPEQIKFDRISRIPSTPPAAGPYRPATPRWPSSGAESSIDRGYIRFTPLNIFARVRRRLSSPADSAMIFKESASPLRSSAANSRMKQSSFHAFDKIQCLYGCLH